jgi:hypothetical protein
LRHEQDGTRYVYLPTKPREQAAHSTMRQVLRTFFGGSVEEAVATLLSASETRLSNEELDRLSALIENARKDKVIRSHAHDNRARCRALAGEYRLAEYRSPVRCRVVRCALRRASAASRHLLWALTIVALLLLPFLNGVVPHRQVFGADEAMPFLGSLFLTASAAPRDEKVVSPAPASAVTSTAPGAGDSAASWLSTWSVKWPELIAMTWLLGVLVCGARVISGRRALRRLRHDSVVLQCGPLWEQMQEAMTTLKLRRAVTLRLAVQESEVVVPLTWGQLRPVVLLPAGAPEWSSLQRRAVLLHELAHVERGDWMTRLASQAACSSTGFIRWCGWRASFTRRKRAGDR